MQQLDVKTPSLHGKLEEEIYMEFTPGRPDKVGRIVQLHKGLYELKQVNCYWNKKLDGTMLNYQYKRISIDHCIYQWVTDSGKSISHPC